MPATRDFALVRTYDQWVRATHEHTSVDATVGCVQLDWREAIDPSSRQPRRSAPVGGLAFDAECRLYHSVPAEGRLERLLWKPHDPLSPLEQRASPVQIVAEPTEPAFGDFQAERGPGSPLQDPRGLAVDVDDRLFVAETGRNRILVYDLWSRRLLRRVSLGQLAPLDLARGADGRTIWVVVDGPYLLRLEARTDPVTEELADPGRPVPHGATAQRIAVSGAGSVYLLYREVVGRRGWVVYRDRPDEAWVTPSTNRNEPRSVAGASDLEVLSESSLVVARRPGEAFARLSRDGSRWNEDTPLLGRGYDGLGIVRTPDGRIGFWTESGFRQAVAARVRYDPRGRVSTFRLDAGQYQTQWGRLFLDACMPRGTAVLAACTTSDDGGEGAPQIGWTPPAKFSDAMSPGKRRDGSPPLVPVALAPADDSLPQRFHRRETGRELPWARPEADDPFETYEAPIVAPPGRYLWVTLELVGTTRATPRVKCLRAEHPAHDYLRRLPRTYSREQAAADFLQRYLSIFEGALGELDARSEHRHALVDPYSAPQEILSWLAGFIGLALDERWPIPVRRRLIAEAACLFRFRGTVRGLEYFLELVLDARARVMLIEHWRLRGLGGALLGEPRPQLAGAVLGSSFRVGGSVGSGDEPGATAPEDAFRMRAHRFTAVIPATLDEVQDEIVRHVLDVHRPAHTHYEICTVGAGMRVGHGLHLGLLSMVGRTGGFAALQLGASLLGRKAIVGRPEAGTRPGSSRLAEDTRVG